MESLTVCSPPPEAVLVLLPAPFEPCEAFPPLQVLATQTGALAFTGAFADSAGSTEAAPTWAVPTDWSAPWSPVPPVPAELALDDPLADSEAFPPLQSLATQTGALALTGAFAATDGFPSVELT